MLARLCLLQTINGTYEKLLWKYIATVIMHSCLSHYGFTGPTMQTCVKTIK